MTRAANQAARPTNTAEGAIVVDKVTRAELIAIASLVITLAALIFNIGVVYQTVQDHERRIRAEEAKSEALIPRVEHIDANVSFLAEQAREQRMKDAKQ